MLIDSDSYFWKSGLSCSQLVEPQGEVTIVISVPGLTAAMPTMQ